MPSLSALARETAFTAAAAANEQMIAACGFRIALQRGEDVSTGFSIEKLDSKNVWSADAVGDWGGSRLHDFSPFIVMARINRSQTLLLKSV